MRVWVFLFWSLQASLSLAADLPEPATRATFPTPGTTSVFLGRDLFFDPVLSGNRNASCASCHHPANATTDAVSLGIGEGGNGLGGARDVGRSNIPSARIARNVPALFNLGAEEFTSLMHDGGVARDPTQRFGIRLPEGRHLERPASVLAAQVLISLVAPDEMAGHAGENLVADLVSSGQITGLKGAWQKLAERVELIPDYRRRFSWLIGPEEPVHIADIATALADFITYEFRATNSPFDDFLNGGDSALNNDQLHGMSLFYGKAGCGDCHSGTFQTDHAFHAIGMPQIGPGKGHGPDYADHGRAAITGKKTDSYRFRTPSLRNVAHTAPYGHSGAYASLDAVIRHHLDAEAALAEYTSDMAKLPTLKIGQADDQAMADFDEVLRIGSAIAIPPKALSEDEITALAAFLGALTDPASLTGRLGPPATVPSGLPVQTPDNRF